MTVLKNFGEKMETNSNNKLKHREMIRQALWTNSQSLYNISIAHLPESSHKYAACIIACWQSMLEELAEDKMSKSSYKYMNLGGFENDCALLQLDYSGAAAVMFNMIRLIRNGEPWEK